MHAAPVQRTILSTRRIMVPPLTLCAYMKKGPNLRWSLIQCSGGDEGDRTPDLLTASQALSQLSYAPVRRSTIRELGRRCKDNFGKTFSGGGEDAGRTRERGPRCPIRPAGCAPRAAVGGTRDVPRAPERRAAATPPFFASAARAAIRPTASPPVPGPLSGPTAPPHTRRFQNHAGLRGQAGNPRACRNR